ncbi:MAG: hypothetical protein Kow00109_19110 [Acidobacteriota bacterium]
MAVAAFMAGGTLLLGAVTGIVPPGLFVVAAPAVQAPAAEDASGEAELQRGIALTRSGRFAEAVPHFLAARGRVRDERVLTFNLALCYVGLGQYAEAVPLLHTLRAQGWNSANVENLLTQALLGAEQPEAAWTAFERASRLAPKDEKLYLYTAESCMAHGYLDLGLRVLQAGLQHLPESPRLLFEHAILLGRLDFFEDAVQELDRIVELAPGTEIGYIAAVQGNLMKNDVAAAVRLAREGIRQGHGHFMLRALFGQAVLQAGAEVGSPEFAEARSALEAAVAENPSYASARLTLGKLYLAEGRLDDAIAHLEEARRLDPANPAVYSNLATAYRRRGDAERAKEMLAVLRRLNKEEENRIRHAPGDRKAGYMGKPLSHRPQP